MKDCKKTLFQNILLLSIFVEMLSYCSAVSIHLLLF